MGILSEGGGGAQGVTSAAGPWGPLYLPSALRQPWEGQGMGVGHSGGLGGRGGQPGAGLMRSLGGGSLPLDFLDLCPRQAAGQFLPGPVAGGGQDT